MIIGKRLSYNRKQDRISGSGLLERTEFLGFKVTNGTFQWKYSLYLLSAVGGSVLIFLGPSLYFTMQNYGIFTHLAYLSRPELLDNLEMEMTWLYAFWAVGAVCTLVFCLTLVFRMTGSILGPLIAMERHMKHLTKGDWTSKDFLFRSTDDFRSLANTYSYLYRALRAHMEKEIRLLEKLNLDPDNKESYAIWVNILESKKTLLNGRRSIDEQRVRLISEPQTSASPEGVVSEDSHFQKVA